MSQNKREARSPNRRGIRRSVVAGLGTAALALTLATPAVAAQPNNQACLGEDIRFMAQGGPAFGAFVSGVLAVDGLGTEIQAHLAGNIPGNSCSA